MFSVLTLRLLNFSCLKDVVLVLLGYYADVNAKDKFNWHTPRHVAAANGALDSLKVKSKK